MRRSWLAALAIFAALLLLATSSALSAFSQVSISQAQLNGTVRDQTGGLVGKAQIILRDVDTNHVYNTASNTYGYYILTNLPPGNYEFTVDAPGFAKYKQTGITLTVGQVATLDIGLKVAHVSEELVVNTEAPTIEPTRSEVSQVIETK